MDQRHEKRKPLVIYLDVIDTVSNQLLGHLGDISHDGLMFLTTTPPVMNTVLNLQIKLDELPEFVEESLQMEVQTLWQKPNINPAWTCIGCRFIKLEVSNPDLIERLAKILSFGEGVEVKRV